MTKDILSEEEIQVYISRDWELEVIYRIGRLKKNMDSPIAKRTITTTDSVIFTSDSNELNSNLQITNEINNIYNLILGKVNRNEDTDQNEDDKSSEFMKSRFNKNKNVNLIIKQ
jgi:hypothetical protein